MITRSKQKLSKLTEKTKKRLRLEALYKMSISCAVLILESGIVPEIKDFAQKVVNIDKKYPRLLPAQYEFVQGLFDKLKNYGHGDYPLEFFLVAGLLTLRDEYDYYKLAPFKEDPLKKELDYIFTEIESIPEFTEKNRKVNAVINSILENKFISSEKKFGVKKKDV